MKTSLMAARSLVAALAALAPAAHAQTVVPQAAAPGIVPFTQLARDAKALAWARRWADENLDDPADRAAMLSYAASAAERREVLARPIPGENVDHSAGGINRTAFTHLRRVSFLVELRLPAPAAGSGAGSPDWNARHLCNGTLIAPRWVLTAQSCVAGAAAVEGIEVRLGVQDLSQDGGQTRRVVRIERNAAAGLALVQLDAAATSAGPAAIAPPKALTAAATTNDQVEFVGLGFGRMALPGWPAVLYRHFSLANRPRELCPDSGDAPTGPCMISPGLRLCAGDNGSPIYVYDLVEGPLLAGVASVPTDAPGGCFENLATRYDEDPPLAPVISVTRWKGWIAGVVGSALPVKEPLHLSAASAYAD